MAIEPQGANPTTQDKLASRIMEMGVDLYRNNERCFILESGASGPAVGSCTPAEASERNATVITPEQLIALSSIPGFETPEKHLITALKLTEKSDVEVSELGDQPTTVDRERNNKLFRQAVDNLFKDPSADMLRAMVDAAAKLGKVVTAAEFKAKLERHLVRLNRVIDAFTGVGDSDNIVHADSFHVQSFAFQYDFLSRETIAMYEGMIAAGGGLTDQPTRVRNYDDHFHTETHMIDLFYPIKDIPPLYDRRGRRVFLCQSKAWNVTGKLQKVGRSALDEKHRCTLSMCLVREPSSEEK